MIGVLNADPMKRARPIVLKSENEGLKKRYAQYRAIQEKLLAMQDRQAEELRQVAALLWSEGRTMRDAGDLLGITGARVHQLVGSMKGALYLASKDKITHTQLAQRDAFVADLAARFKLAIKESLDAHQGAGGHLGTLGCLVDLALIATQMTIL